jgi:hypothetical protein
MAAGGGSILSETQQVCDVDLYGHLYDDELDTLADALDRRLADPPAPPARPQRAPRGRGEVVPLHADRPGSLM